MLRVRGFRSRGSLATGYPQFRGDPVWSQKLRREEEGRGQRIELTGAQLWRWLAGQCGTHLEEGIGKGAASARNGAWLASSRKTSAEAFVLKEAEGDEGQEGYMQARGSEGGRPE